MITDKNVLELMKLDLKSEIKMTIHRNTNVYIFNTPKELESLELYIKGDKTSPYGLGCDSLLEGIGILIQDYANGIITDIEVRNKL